MKDTVEIYVDGACSGNPGPGGWGVLLRYRGTEKTLSGAQLNATNNQMELMAAIQGLNALVRPCQVKLYTDSEYVKHGITQWVHQWQLHWVKGHSNHPENDKVDALARAAIDKLLKSQG